MKVSEFIGKKVNLEKAKFQKFISYCEPDDMNGLESPILIVRLHNFELNGFTDKNGFTGYSLEVQLTDEIITEIVRYANLDMCSGGNDYERNRFSKSLEDEAQEKLWQIIL